MESTYTIFRVTPGWMGLVGNKKGVQRIYLPGLKKQELKRQIISEFPGCKEDAEFWKEVKSQFKEYFWGQRKIFQIPLDLTQATPFQRKVYRIMAKIPYGQVRTYHWLAQKIGKPLALRAIGLANAKNRWPLVIPCHRVLGQNGHLTGFSAPGGLSLKAYLLKLEGVPVINNRVLLSK